MNAKSPFSGAMIVAGSAIGAGIFSLPIASSGMWFALSILALILVWLVSYLSTLILLEINMHFQPGTSFNTFIKSILGNGWNIVSGLSIGFLMYILLYAYFSAFGSMAGHTFPSVAGSSSQGMLGLALGIVLAAFVGLSTKAVGRLSTILLSAMVVSFVLTISELSFYVKIEHLFETSLSSENWKYFGAGLPYYLSACAFTSMVPSLYKYYGKEPITIKKSLLYGAIISLVIYIVWLIISFGVIPRSSFEVISASGGNMGDLVTGFEQNASGSNVKGLLTFFSNFAIISSFLGVGLTLYDYILDRFQLQENIKGKLIAATITFSPPALASFIYPKGFISAIGFAGIVVVFLFFVLPYFMVKSLRKNNKNNVYQLKGGHALILAVLLVGLAVATCQILSGLQILPKF